jgi:hypothetical protein
MGAVLPDELPAALVPESKRGGLHEAGAQAVKAKRSRFGMVGGMVGLGP